MHYIYAYISESNFLCVEKSVSYYLTSCLSREACSRIWGEELKGLVEDRGKRGQLEYQYTHLYSREAHVVGTYCTMHSRANVRSQTAIIQEVTLNIQVARIKMAFYTKCSNTRNVEAAPW